MDKLFIDSINNNDINGVIDSIDAGVNIHCNNDFALWYSILHQNLDIITLLVVNGMNVNTNDGDTFLLAVELGYFDIVSYMVKHGAYHVNALIVNAESRHANLKIITLLVENGADIHYNDDYAV